MKLLFWVLGGPAAASLSFWLVTNPEIPRNPFLIFLLIVVYSSSPIGSFWMLYTAIRYEKRPMPMIFLAFLPFAAFWYYFERIRPAKFVASK